MPGDADYSPRPSLTSRTMVGVHFGGRSVMTVTQQERSVALQSEQTPVSAQGVFMSSR
jgi:hypothetical protein